MEIYAQMRGHKIFFDNENWVWRYLDNNMPADDSRPCILCKKHPTKNDGHDPCLGYIPNALAACCGHGVEKGYVYFPNMCIRIKSYNVKILEVKK